MVSIVYRFEIKAVGMCQLVMDRSAVVIESIMWVVIVLCLIGSCNLQIVILGRLAMRKEFE